MSETGTTPEAHEHRSSPTDYRLDIRGEICPYPVMYSLEALGAMQTGQVLEVVADCPQSFRNVPEEVVKHGHQLLADPQRHGSDLFFRFRARP